MTLHDIFNSKRLVITRGYLLVNLGFSNASAFLAGPAAGASDPATLSRADGGLYGDLRTLRQPHDLHRLAWKILESCLLGGSSQLVSGMSHQVVQKAHENKNGVTTNAGVYW